MWHKAEWMGHPMRLELTLIGLLPKLAEHNGLVISSQALTLSSEIFLAGMMMKNNNTSGVNDDNTFLFVCIEENGDARDIMVYRRRKWTRSHKYKSWMRLIAFCIALIIFAKGMNPIILPPAMC